MRGGGWLTITEAAHTFAVSHSTLYRLIAQGELPSKRVGGQRKEGSGHRGGGTLFVETASLKKLWGQVDL